MRILFSSGPMYGHVNTLLPLALRARHAGHDVVVATGADLAPHVERYGIAAWPVGLTHAGLGGSRQESWIAYFAASARQRARDLMPLAQAWRPDIVVHEETDLAGPIVARRCGALHVVHGLGLMPPERVWQSFEPALAALGQAWELPSLAESIRTATYLHVCPQALQPAGPSVWSHDVLPLRPVAGIAAPDDRLPALLADLPYTRTIHLTLGTVFHEASDVLARAIDGLSRLSFNLVVAAGPASDPRRFGVQPRHVVIARYVPHALLLRRCVLVVSQGGAGIMFGALSHGLPQLIVPQGADQFMNAEACRRAGAALTLPSAEASVDAIAASARRLLAEPEFASAARRVQAQIAALPDAGAVLADLLARSRAQEATAGA